MWVKIKGQTRNKGQYSSMELVRRNGRWYAVATMQCWPVRGKGNVAVGIDLGLETLATVAYDTHDRKTEKINNPRFLKRQLQKLKAAQRVLAKKKRGSGRRGKAEKVVVRIHEKIANQRRDFIHQETAKIVGKVDLIATETLKVKKHGCQRRSAEARAQPGIAQRVVCVFHEDPEMQSGRSWRTMGRRAGEDRETNAKVYGLRPGGEKTTLGARAPMWVWVNYRQGRKLRRIYAGVCLKRNGPGTGLAWRARTCCPVKRETPPIPARAG